MTRKFPLGRDQSILRTIILIILQHTILQNVIDQHFSTVQSSTEITTLLIYAAVTADDSLS